MILIYPFISLLAILAAFVAEYGMGLKPCALCLYQRIPYYIGLIGFVSYFIPQYQKYFRIFYIALFLASVTLAFYHMGVEYKWFSYHSECTSQITGNNIDQIKAQLLSQAIVRCDEPALIIFGLSMAGWNFILSLLLIILLIFLKQKNYEK